MLTGYDSTNPFDIPTDAKIVFGYIDGTYAWPQAGWERFPNAIRKTITVMSGIADVADCETGDMTPAMCPPWVLRMRALGRDPWVYMNLNTWASVRGAFQSAGVAEPKYWTAGYFDGAPRLDPGAIATQYANEPLAGGHYDLSLVNLEGEVMEQITRNSDNGAEYVWDKDGLRHIEAKESADRIKLGAQVVNFTTAQLGDVKIWPDDSGSGQGLPGKDGAPGKDGSVGPEGPPGKDGAPGADGTKLGKLLTFLNGY